MATCPACGHAVDAELAPTPERRWFVVLAIAGVLLALILGFFVGRTFTSAQYESTLRQTAFGRDVFAQERERLDTALADATRERDEVRRQLAAQIQEHDRLNASLRTVTQERDRLNARLTEITQERDTLAQAHEQWAGQLTALARERDTLVGERDAVARERDASAQERQQLQTRERKWLDLASAEGQILTEMNRMLRDLETYTRASSSPSTLRAQVDERIQSFLRLVQPLRDQRIKLRQELGQPVEIFVPRG